MIKGILNFLGTYFEMLIAIDIFFLIGGVVILIAAHLRQLSFRKVLNQALYYFLLFCQGGLLTLTVIVIFYNLAQIRPLDFSAQILSTTRWVKDRTEIFFIADKELVSIKANGDNRKVIFKGDDRISQYHFSPNGK